MSEESFLKGSWLAKQFADGPVPHKVFTYGGCGDRFGAAKTWAVRSPSALDDQDSLAAARKWLEGKGWKPEELQLGEIGAQAFDAVSRAWIVSRSLVNPEDPTQLACVDGAQVLALMHIEEVDYFFETVVDYQQERSVLSRGDLSLDKIDEVIDDLGKALLPPTWWKSYGSASLARLLQRAADRLASPAKDK